MFTKEQNDLLAKIQSQVLPSIFTKWPQVQLAILVDIYAGIYAAIHERDEQLAHQYSEKLIQYCEAHNWELPKVQEDNVVLRNYYERLKQEEKLHNLQKPSQKIQSVTGFFSDGFKRKTIKFYDTIRDAAENGHTNTICRLLSQCSGQVNLVTFI